MATRLEIKAWLDKAKANGATHLIIVCDTFDYEDYPVQCMSPEECKEKFKELDGKNMQRIMEVYDLSMSIDEQLKHARVMNLPA